MAKSRTKARAIVSACAARPRPLLVLNDQGHLRSVTLDLFGSPSGRDRSWNPYAQAFIQANRSQLDAIEVQPQLCRVQTRFGCSFGLARSLARCPRCTGTWRIIGGVVVRHALAGNDIGPMLYRIGWTACAGNSSTPLVPGRPARCRLGCGGAHPGRLGRLLRELRRGFSMQEEVRQSPRGQILWQRYITWRTRAARCIPSPALPVPGVGAGPDVASLPARGLESWLGSLASQSGAIRLPGG